MSLTSLKDMWHDRLPSIVTAKPMTDLCEVCQANNYLIYKASNLSDEAKLERLQQQTVCIAIQIYFMVLDIFHFTCY